MCVVYERVKEEQIYMSLFSKILSISVGPEDFLVECFFTNLLSPAFGVHTLQVFQNFRAIRSVAEFFLSNVYC